MLESPEKILSRIETINRQTQALRSRMTFDLERANGKEFKIDPKEGKFESVTSNRARKESWKIRNLLSNGKLKLNIAIVDEKEKGRDNITATEHLVNGMIYKAIRNSQLLPGLPDIDMLLHTNDLHELTCAMWTVLGSCAHRLMMVKDAEDNAILDWEVWNPLRLWWVAGKNGLIWVPYKFSISKEQADDEYKGHTGQPDNVTGLIDVYDFWGMEGGKAHEGVFINKQWVKAPKPVGLDYLPIRIQVGESFLANNRNLIDAESRMMSYRLTAAGKESKPTRGIKFDGNIDNTPPIKDNDPDPGVKSGWIPLDISKGHDIVEIPESKLNIINIFSAELQGQMDSGGLGEIAYGRQNMPMTATAVDITNHNTREHLQHFIKSVQQDYIWIASEICKQYKYFKLDAVELEGYDPKFQRFKAKIKPEQVLVDREFTAELVIDELRDRAAHSQMAINEIKAGLIDRRTALDLHKLHDDPDRVIKNIEHEMAKQAFGVVFSDGLFELIADARENKLDAKTRYRLNIAYMNLMKMMMSNMPMPGMGEPGGMMPASEGGNGGMRPRNTARMPQPSTPANLNIPPSVREAAQNEQRGQAA